MIAAQQKYLFLHIPKTAGTSLIEVFRHTLGAGNVYHNAFAQPPSLRAADKFRLVGGHFLLAAVSPLFESRKTIVFLRDPVDRVVSSFYFARECTDPLQPKRDPGVALAKDMPLFDFLGLYAGKHASAYTNLQAWTMSGCPDVPQPPEIMLENAKANLERCAFVGLAERFQESVDMLCFDFGWPIIEDKPFANRTINRPRVADIDDKVRDLIRALNPMDVELYRFAVGLFERKKHDLWRRACAAGGASTPAASNLHVVSADAAELAAVGLPETESAPMQPREFGSKEIRIDRVDVVSARGKDEPIRSGDAATIRIHIDSSIDLHGLSVGIRITDDMGNVVYGTNSSLLQQSLDVRAGRAYIATYNTRFPLQRGTYWLTAALHLSIAHNEGCFHWLDNCLSFHILPDPAANLFDGPVSLPVEFSFEDARARKAWRLWPSGLRFKMRGKPKPEKVA